MAAFGWTVLTALALAFLLGGLLECIGVSDRPEANGWQLLALAAAFATVSVLTFPF